MIFGIIFGNILYILSYFLEVFFFFWIISVKKILIIIVIIVVMSEKRKLFYKVFNFGDFIVNNVL